MPINTSLLERNKRDDEKKGMIKKKKNFSDVTLKHVGYLIKIN
jgi:hypothetical protein